MKHFVRIHYNVPELGGELLNIAELEEISAHECTMVRMIELDPAETITGIYVDGRVIGQANQPMPVPQPAPQLRIADNWGSPTIVMCDWLLTTVKDGVSDRGKLTAPRLSTQFLSRFGSQHRLWGTAFPCGANGSIG